MSGTSLDGVDAVVAEFGDAHTQILATHWQPYPAELKAALLELHTPGPNELDRSLRLANTLADHYAAATLALLEKSGIAKSSILASGCHGQTLRHQPALGYTLQLNNGARLAETTGITTITDFRSRDIAAGGQGAPLVPAFHAGVFAAPDRHRLIVNIGGISNLTDLPAHHAEQPIRGWDCGPGNLLLDSWVRRHFDCEYDAGGAIAACGQVQDGLLAHCLAHPFLAQQPPKSTGREDFTEVWLDARLGTTPYRAEDVLATLLEFTARAIADDIRRHCPDATEIYLCGGGAHNQSLSARLTALLAPRRVANTDVLGIAADWVEATAFAWLAQCTMTGKSGNLPAVTGARGARILGAIYPA